MSVAEYLRAQGELDMEPWNEPLLPSDWEPTELIVEGEPIAGTAEIDIRTFILSD